MQSIAEWQQLSMLWGSISKLSVNCHKLISRFGLDAAAFGSMMQGGSRASSRLCEEVDE
jgi:hypothetical protein